jgi:predicted phosphodiesterase
VASWIDRQLLKLTWPQVPDEILASSSCLIHVSDTPASFYPFLFRLLKIIKPAVLVHTGDLMDQIKLEHRSYMINCYQEQIQRYLPRLEQMPVNTIYLVPGNHDNPHIIANTCRRSRLVPASSLIKFGPFNIGLAHQPQYLPAGADFSLYGHGPDKPPATSGRPLSGLASINILLDSGVAYSLPYPHGTNAARGLKIRPTKI